MVSIVFGFHRQRAWTAVSNQRKLVAYIVDECYQNGKAFTQFIIQRDQAYM